MLTDTEKSIYEQAVYDSVTERDVTAALENNDAIELYAKPSVWFKALAPLAAIMFSWKQSLGVDHKSSATDLSYLGLGMRSFSAYSARVTLPRLVTARPEATEERLIANQTGL